MERKNKVITCASYGGSGSSAITDLLKEFSSCNSLGDFEFTFLHYPNGVLDLELKIIENKHRLVSGYTINKFIEEMKRLEKHYSIYFGNEFGKITDKYINKLVTLSWKGSNELFTREEKLLKKIVKRLKTEVIKKIFGTKEGMCFEDRDYFMYFSNLTNQEFYEITKEYTNNLLELLNKENIYKYQVLDQLVPSTNIDRFFNYFYDLKVIVVDRDPRDIYILNKEFWKETWIPEDIEIFIEWFKITREYKGENEKEKLNKNILKIRFEDLIYKYDETLRNIMLFLELEKKEHVYPKVYFNNKVSERNTKLYEKYPKYKNEMKKIEKELKKYCYVY